MSFLRQIFRRVVTEDLSQLRGLLLKLLVVLLAGKLIVFLGRSMEWKWLALIGILIYFTAYLLLLVAGFRFVWFFGHEFYRRLTRPRAK